MELKAEEARAKDKQQHKEKFRQYQQSYNKQTFNHMNTSSGGISLSQEEARVVDFCYRVMATQLRPDKGGDVEDMKILNGLKDKIRNRS